MKRIIVYLVSIFLCCSCASVRTTHKDFVLYKGEGDTPIKELTVAEIKTMEYSKLFPMNRVLYNGMDGSVVGRVVVTIIVNVYPFCGILIAADLICLPFQLLGNALSIGKKSYSYSINLSVDSKVVDINNKPVKNKEIIIKFYGEQFKLRTDNKGFIKETVTVGPINKKFNKKSERIDIMFDLKNVNPKKIYYDYPYKKGTRYFADKYSNIKESKIKAEGKVIVTDSIK